MKPKIINIKGYDVEIILDYWKDNPREWVSSTLVTAHKNYTFGGIKLTRDAWSIEGAFQQHLADEGLSLRDIIYYEVFMYEHSGIALNIVPFSCRFDSGQLGYIYEKRSDIRAEFGVKRISPKLEQRVLSRLFNELQLLEYWVNGEVYSFSIADDVYGGFDGYDHEKSGLITAATDTVNAIRQQKLREHTDKLKRLIKAGVSLQYHPMLNLEV